MNAVCPNFKELFQTVNDPMIIINFSGEIEFYNQAASQFFQLRKNEKHTLTMDDLSQSSWTSFLEKMKKHQNATCTLNIILPNKHVQKVTLIGHLFEKKKLIFAKVVSQSLQTSFMYDYVSYLLDDVSHGIVITNMSGKIVDINMKALQYLKFEYSDILHQEHSKLFENVQDYEFNKLKYIEQLDNLGSATINLSYNNKEFYRVDSKFNVRKKFTVTTITDVSNEVKLKETLKHRESNFEVNQMTASIAHEIRNPMTSLKGFIELLRNDTSDDCNRYLDVMESELQRMEALLTDVLNLSKSSKRTQKIDVIKTIKEVIELMKPYTMQNNIIIRLNHEDSSQDLFMLGSQNRIKQMLINLIKNAIEVMPTGGLITIDATKLDDSTFQLSVHDEGTGIRKEDLAKLFKPFFTTKSNGTGLGLPIVKKIVEEHHGNIQVESILNYGTTFIIEFPIVSKTHLINENKDIINKVWFRNTINSLSIT